MEQVYDFGLILQKLRKEKGLTQSQLAKKINKESSVISRYEKNLQTPTFDTVRQLATIFNVSMDYLSGTERESLILVNGLSDSQVRLIHSLCDEFKKKNEAMIKSPTSAQYEVIGRLVVELLG